MKAFADLYRALDASTSILAKQAALQQYLREAAPDDAAWAIFFLAGGKPRQLVPSRLLRELVREAAALPPWLFEESYQAVGDLAETLSLLLPPPTAPQEQALSIWLLQHLLPLRGLSIAEVTTRLHAQWRQLPAEQRLVYFKLITGSLRVGVSRLQVTQALAAIAGLDAKLIAQRLMGYTDGRHQPDAATYLALLAPERACPTGERSDGQPYPFFLAHPLPATLEEFDTLLGPVEDWLAEWKWDGIRAQLVRRAGQTWLWSRGEDLITERFPELDAAAASLPSGTVLDGEILIWHGAEAPPLDSPAGAAARAQGALPAGHISTTGLQPFSELQRRIGRKTLTPRLLRELPAVLLAYDLLEWQGQDLRALPQAERRKLLENAVNAAAHPALRLSPEFSASSWQALAALREQARSLGTEGLMLKRRDSAYGVGRTRTTGLWWKWKLDPMSVDAVLIYAQRGHGRRASLYTDYTFAVWSGPPEDPARTLIPFAKAYSGLTDAEMRAVDAIIRKTTRDSFGPVRSVEPTLVFELGFEGISLSPRHKSGIAVRFPRMLRWRTDKPVTEADSLDTLKMLLADCGRGDVTPARSEASENLP